jgi:8-oxo-dGTP diphosphatase
MGETTEEACMRETLEETGVEVSIESLFGVFSRPDRDPRGHTVSVAYRCRPRGAGEVRGGDDAAEARWHSRKEIAETNFAFDHGEIVRAFLREG